MQQSLFSIDHKPVDHVAILNKKKALITKIVSGQKEIESRRYKARRAPRDKIAAGDTVYFKETGGLVTAKAEVDQVMQFDKLNMDKLKEIVNVYGKRIDIQNKDYSTWGIGINYCILVSLKNAKYIKPFAIDKKGYGISTARMVVGDIEKVKKESH